MVGAGPAHGSLTGLVRLLARCSWGILKAGPAVVQGAVGCVGVAGPALTGGAEELRVLRGWVIGVSRQPWTCAPAGEWMIGVSRQP
eukprot:6465150-Amphidinium_carterae.1